MDMELLIIWQWTKGTRPRPVRCGILRTIKVSQKLAGRITVNEIIWTYEVASVYKHINKSHWRI